MKTTAASPRSRGADLLRIVSMLMILTSHFFVHGKVLSAMTPRDLNFHIAWFIEGSCYVMVNCFVLITGYFQSATTFKLKKLLLLWGQVIVLSGGVYLALVLLGKIPFAWSTFLPAATPVTSQRYWFVTAFVVFYALTPFFNWTIRRMDRQTHFKLCAALFGIFVLARNFVYWQDFMNLHGGYSYTSFVVLYYIGAYLRRFPPKKRPWLAYYFALSAITAGSRILMTVLWYRYQFSSDYLKVFMQYNSVPVVLASVCLFQFFVTRKIGNRAACALIDFFAPLTFGIYILHEQRDFKYPFWEWYGPAKWAKTPQLFPRLLMTVVLMFLACAAIEFLRRTLSKLLHIPDLFGRFAAMLERWAGRILRALCPPSTEEADSRGDPGQTRNDP